MKKISFSDKFGLTRAVLEGRKTMTRRIIPQRTLDHILGDFRQEYYDATLDVLGDKECIVQYFLVEKAKGLPYKPGEVVAVAQAYNDIMAYLADPFYQPDPSYMRDKAGWDNKMFVKADLMPHQIRITSVKVERLQDISNDDCLREGIERRLDTYTWRGRIVRNIDPEYGTPREAFAALIDKICGRGTWKANPFVFVYEFELVR
jgi:hypothetical protein